MASQIAKNLANGAISVAVVPALMTLAGLPPIYVVCGGIATWAVLTAVGHSASDVGWRRRVLPVMLMVVCGVGLFGSALWFHQQKPTQSATVTPPGLDLQLSADRAEALRELAKLRRPKPATSLDGILRPPDRLNELMDVINLGPKGSEYAHEVTDAFRSYQFAYHTVGDTPENSHWKSLAEPYYRNRLNAYATALDSLIRGGDGSAELAKKLGEAGPAPPQAAGQNWAPDTSQERFMLIRTASPVAPVLREAPAPTSSASHAAPAEQQILAAQRSQVLGIVHDWEHSNDGIPTTEAGILDASTSYINEQLKARGEKWSFSRDKRRQLGFPPSLERGEAVDVTEAQSTVHGLWQVWMNEQLSNGGATSEVRAGLVLPPDNWMNDHLAKMNRPYRVRAKGSVFEIYPLEDKHAGTQ